MPINGLGNLMGLPGGPRKPTWRWNLKFFFMESISIKKGATSVKKEAEKVQRQKSFFFAQIPPAFIQCIVRVLMINRGLLHKQEANYFTLFHFS